ncbi:DUF2982 domain-containing protein [Candidatus Gracilibacteria bacterium]|nr:DUF2982 domain-containing protein [Candidatus Gracilibacteria bacterium]
MRISPDHPRLRVIALCCWIVGGWCFTQAGILVGDISVLLNVSLILLSSFCFAVGIGFWLLGTDHRAGVVLDPKGLMLNLGQSAAFVSWDNIAEIASTQRRSSLLALGSTQQIGIRLHDIDSYLQSYEPRLPASHGFFAQLLRALRSQLARQDHVPSYKQLTRFRHRTGFDLIIPEAQLGGRAEAFVELIEIYRYNPRQRRELRFIHGGNVL